MLIHAKVYETNLQRMRYLNNPSSQTFADSKKKKKKEKQTKQSKKIPDTCGGCCATCAKNHQERLRMTFIDS